MAGLSYHNAVKPLSSVNALKQQAISIKTIRWRAFSRQWRSIGEKVALCQEKSTAVHDGKISVYDKGR
jgi:hypothetical protein